MPDTLDALTLRRAQRGDRDAQEAFLQRYVRPLRGLVLRAGPSGDVDDLTQDLMRKMLDALPRFRPEGSAQLTTWVFAVAQRWLIDVSRKRHLALVPLEQAAEVPDGAAPLDDQLTEQQLERRLELALRSLPEDQRRTFVLAQVYQRPLTEIAEAEAVPLGTVKSRLHRARAALVGQLGDVLQDRGGSRGSARRA